MGKKSVLFTVALSILTAYLSLTFFGDNNVPDVENTFWGKGEGGGKKDTKPKPFQIKVDDKVLADLKKRLQLELSAEGNRLTESFAGQGFQYGINANYLKKVGDYWLNKYDWRQREKLLNKYAQFKMTVSGLDIHYVHAKSSNNAKYNVTRPLLLLHGWPGSFVELQKIIPLLTDPQEDNINFEVIVPSLPGFGYSDAPSKPGFGPVEAAQLMLVFMKQLGHDRFYVQGGDWGSVIATNMASLYHNNVIALHVNLCNSFHPRIMIRYLGYYLFYPLFYTSEEANRLLPPSGPIGRILEHSGYFHLQATKPDTIAVALANSPLGLAGYILEKFALWTNLEGVKKDDGGLSEVFPFNELLDNVMIYWVTNTIGTSMRFYKEAVSEKQLSYGMNKVPTYVPTACLISPHEYLAQAELLLTDKYPQLMSYKTLEKGGHFSSFQVPQDVSKDIIQFFNKIEVTGLIDLYKRKIG